MLQAALRLLADGFCPIPLLPGTKKSRIPWSEFQRRLPTEGEIEQWWSAYPMDNIGLVLGRGVCVVDADSQEAVDWVGSNLPRTPWAVRTFRGLHFYYRTSGDVPSLSSAKLKVDLQSTGKYVVAPPSTHKTGTIYQWEKACGTEGWSACDLPIFTPRDAAAIASGCLQDGARNAFDLRSVPLPLRASIDEPVAPGGRNIAAASIVGQLVHQGLSEREILETIGRWNQGNPSPLPKRELDSVVHSILKTHARNTGERIAGAVDEGALVIRPTSPSAAEEPPAMRPLGVLGEVFDFYQSSAPHPNATLATQAALALGSVVLGRRYSTVEHNFSSLYFLSIAKSTTGKEHARTTINAILNAADAGNLLGGSGYTSSGAVYSELKRKPCHIAIIDEFGRYLEAAQAASNSPLKEAITVLVEAFGALHSSVRPKAYSTLSGQDASETVIDKPAITLLGLSTPLQFYEALKLGDIESGVLGRVLVVESKAPRQKRQRTRTSAEPPRSVVDWVKAARSGNQWLGGGELACHDKAPEPSMLAFSPEALSILDRYEDEVLATQSELEEQGLDVLLGRCVEVAMRVSLVLALSVSLRSQEIGGPEAAWAVAYVRRASLALIEAVRSRMNESGYAALRRKVLDAVTAAGTQGLTEYEAGRKLKSIEPRRRVEILRDLRSSHEIELVRFNTSGRPRDAWVALKDECEFLN